ncbi:putative ATP-dependent RNA helicase DDX11-like protein 8 [Halotydeus destructor]|nr:putative ATP-dependent RNA helicase DDX11-like protein 8 [Halotydeus destructor]
MANFEFGFPFKPYSIQVDFMKELYGVLNERKIGLFESPTGTGKSLSLICASLYWLKENQEKEKSKLSVQSTKLDENLRKLDDEKEYGAGGWVAVHSRKKEYMSEKDNVKHLLDIITKKEERSEYFKQRRLTGRKLNAKGRSALNVKRKHNESKGDDELATADDLDLVTYDSDEDVDAENKPEDDVKNDEEQSRIKPKIYYCSRTHSQLAQFVNEIKRTKYAEGLRLVTLGSRANLCVNSEVNKTSNVNVLNDRCLEMQKNSSKKKKCSYMKATGLTELRDDILSDILDIEEAATNGKLTSSCSYYASRLAIPEAEIIILPYNILLHKKTRTSYGINLSDSVIIVDEAHNLLETIASVHSSSLFLEQLRTCSSQLNLYMERYKSRLSPKNLSYIEQMILFVKSMASFLWPEKKDDKKSHEILTVMDLKLVAGIENLNLFKLLDHCEKSQIARKLFGFSTSAYYKKLDPSDLTDSSRPVVSSPLAKPLTSSQPTMGINALLSRMTKQRQPKKRKTPVNEVVPVSSNLSIENKGTKEDGEPPKPSSPLYQVLEFIKCLEQSLR